MASASVPSDRLRVLEDELKTAIRGRPVRAAVFTTYSFDPGFFELQVLPSLFASSFHQADHIRRIQLEDALRSTDAVAVYYDGSALSGDAQPAHLDVARIGVHRRQGCFHPKLVLALVEDDADDQWETTSLRSRPEALVVGTLSANLTRAGWWENVEAGHFEEIRDRNADGGRERPCSFRTDLLALLAKIEREGQPSDDHVALHRITDFLKRRAPRTEPANRTSRGRFHPRIFHGQHSLATWLRDLRIHRHDWNLEIVSPYFDHADRSTLQDLIEAIEPREVRVHLPRDHMGDATVTPACLASIGERATWSTLPNSVLAGGNARALQSTTRRVHAKVYRLWNTDGRELILVGSPNLTSAAHSAGAAGNLEAAFLKDTGGKERRLTWWLEPLDSVPDSSPVAADERESIERAPLPLHLRYDWSRHRLEFRLDRPAQAPVQILTLAGTPIGVIEPTHEGPWRALPDPMADAVRDLLPTTSLLGLRHAKTTWPVLVRETGMAMKPSLAIQLSPEDILRYWSMLSPAQRGEFLESHASTGGPLESRKDQFTNPGDGNTIFDRFAGLFHAFEHQYHRLRSDLDHKSRRAPQAVSLLFGSKYDSLPVLLEKSLASLDDAKTPGDPVQVYLTHLCGRQLLNRLEPALESILAENPNRRCGLEARFESLDSLRSRILTEAPDRADFLDWFEDAFLESQT